MSDVFRWTALANRWLGNSKPSPALVAPFVVMCVCGSSVRGFRTATAQTPLCPACGSKVFVLAASPLPARETPSGTAAGKQPAPIQAGAPFQSKKARRITTILVLAGALGAIAFVAWPQGKATPSVEDSGLAVERHIVAGKEALAEGSFQLAAEELGEAAQEVGAHPEHVDPENRAILQRLRREADLLADLLTESLEEILRNLEGLDYRESQAVFRRRYQGKSVVFLSRLRRDPAGYLRLDYQVTAPRRPARLDLRTLDLFRGIPLEEPVDVFFGASLAAIERDTLGQWSITFQPESGVFLTDLEPALACCGQPIDEAELRAILRRQEEWLKRIP